MAAPKGNKYNEIWTKEKVKKMLDKAVGIAKSGALSFTDIALSLNLSTSNFKRILYKFEDYDYYKKDIIEIIKNNIIIKALNNEINTTMAIFVLKCNHNMIPVEKIEQKNIVRNVDITEKEAQQIAKMLDEKLDI